MESGDVVINVWAESEDPNRCLLYVGKYNTNAGNMYNFITHDGRKVKYFIHDDVLMKVIGHMDEYDAFMDALKRLAKNDER